MLRIEQTLTCDICSSEIRSLTQTVFAGNGPMQMIQRGPTGASEWTDVCEDCHDPLLNAVWVLKKVKAAK